MVIDKIVELNDMYGNQASSRNIAGILKDEFGFGSFSVSFFFEHKVSCLSVRSFK